MFIDINHVLTFYNILSGKALWCMNELAGALGKLIKTRGKQGPWAETINIHADNSILYILRQSWNHGIPLFQ
jgi:hypothetical protein